MSYPNARDCKHGNKRGKCDLCDMDERIAELEAYNATRTDELLATAQAVSDGWIDDAMALAHRWALACYYKGLNKPYEDIDHIRGELRAMLAAAIASEKESGMPGVTMQDAINAGDGTLHGAIDHWQNRCAELEEKLKAAEIVIGAAECVVAWDWSDNDADCVADITGLEAALAKI